MTLRYPCIVLLSLLAPVRCWSDVAPVQEDDPLRERLAAAVNPVVREVMADEHLPGVAVVVVREGRTMFSRGYGLADVARRIPVDPQATLFRIGSVSKALTALAITRLADLGQLSLEDHVADYYEGFEEVANPHASR
ncbi:MAG: serine hydrolase domain-containing protein, partial [Pseudomonadota bacterium]